MPASTVFHGPSPWTHGALVCLLTIALAVGPSAPSTASGKEPTGTARIPSDLAAQGDQLRADLAELAQAENVSAMQAHLGPIAARASEIVEHATDLHAREGERLGLFIEGLEQAVRDGNATDARSLARAAVNLLEGSIVPSFEAWERNGTAVIPGSPTRDGRELVVPIVLVNPPPGGIGAFDVQLRVEDGWRPTDVSIELGQGEARLDPGNRTARIASFDAKALSGFGSGTQPYHALGAVMLAPDEGSASGNATVDLTVIELATSQGDRVLALGIGGELDAAGAPEQGGILGGSTLAWGAVGLLALVAIGAGRRWLSV